MAPAKKARPPKRRGEPRSAAAGPDGRVPSPVKAEPRAASPRRTAWCPRRTNGRRPAAPRSTRGKYVYCVVQATEALKFGAIGLGTEPAEVHTVHYKDIAAVVSDTPIEVPDATRENVLAHERVNESVMRTHTVIPMSFGTVFKTPNDIVELLRGAYDAFTDVLGKMEDKLEFGLKLSGTATWPSARSRRRTRRCGG